jgi:hypothetical protein
MASWMGFGSPGDLLGKTDFDCFAAEHARAAHEDEQRIPVARSNSLMIKHFELLPTRYAQVIHRQYFIKKTIDIFLVFPHVVCGSLKVQKPHKARGDRKRETRVERFQG